VIDDNNEHPENDLAPIQVIEFERVIDNRAEHPPKHR
jgi:hypothetical protein